MHQQANTEKELMEWFDRQQEGTKWRINAYVIRTGRPMAETLGYLKSIEERGARLQLIHPGNCRKH
ncbi:MAG: hypothetical protein WD071_02320 [Pseudohongiella sp.]|uniref:hypothetical protein n=1 Tax=Pseudohongiella sp. TaxID=1979412 RepID=UPI00349FD7D0